MKARILICTALLVSCSGCWESVQIKSFAEDVTQLSAKFDDYQVVIDDVLGLLERDGLITKELMGKVDKANEEIDRIQVQTTDVATAIKDADYVSGDDVGNIIKAAKAGTAATAPWNPYAAPILLGLTLIEGILLLIFKKKVTVATNKQQADKEGREKTLREIAALPTETINAPLVKSMMYSNIGDARRAIL